MRDCMLTAETLGSEAKAQATGHMSECKGWVGRRRLPEELPLTMEDGSRHGEGEAVWKVGGGGEETGGEETSWTVAFTFWEGPSLIVCSSHFGFSYELACHHPVEVFPVTQRLTYLYALTVSLSNSEMSQQVMFILTPPALRRMPSHRSDIMDGLLGHLFPQPLRSPLGFLKHDRTKTLLPARPARPQTTVDLPFFLPEV